MAKEFIIRERRYYSYQDEKHFFEWLESIGGVKRVVGGPKGLSVQLKRSGLSRGDLYDMTALLMRYGLDMRGLAALVRPQDAAWFRSPQAYWYAKVFGSRRNSAKKAPRKRAPRA